MTYVDGFVLAVPTANREAYRAHAAKTVDWFRRHGALALVECWGDDVPDGVLTSFPMAVKKAADETVVFAWISWPDKETRDAAHKAMADNPVPDFMAMPFDGKRMIYGGFEVILDA
ncbi:MAG: DUF1428 domain-containing protein [Sphingomonadaceae bacterium]